MLRDSRVLLSAVVVMLLLALFSWIARDHALPRAYWATKGRVSPSGSAASPGGISRRSSTVVGGVGPGPLG